MKTRFYRLLGLVVLLVSIGSVTGASAQSQSAAHQENSPSLYKRLGGYDALAAVTDDFVGRLVSDKQLARFFGGVSRDSQKRIRQLVLDQLCAATGGPCIYIGRSMRTVHEGLGITEADWNVAVKHLSETLEKFKVGKAEQDDLLKILGPLKADIVDKK
ncbi:MAG TPA: group 1 truncated hemoglobin [Pyrinomonadaceae bacterium]